jgi:very-short-patch-repair endonuclease
MRKDQVHNREALKENRKELRKALTPAEAILWNEIKGYKLKGRKFRRQHSIDTYIADFYCASEKLIIELDGGYHNSPDQKSQDLERDEILKALGLKILRIKNNQIFNNLDLVLKEIESNFSTVNNS